MNVIVAPSTRVVAQMDAMQTSSGRLPIKKIVEVVLHMFPLVLSVPRSVAYQLSVLSSIRYPPCVVPVLCFSPCGVGESCTDASSAPESYSPRDAVSRET